MADPFAVDVDLAALRREDGSLRSVLAWGDRVNVLSRDANRIEVEVTNWVTEADGSVRPQTASGFLKRKAGSREVAVPAADSKVLKVDFVDVQQGDGAVLQTPAGKVLTLDGGDNQLFARYLANRFRHTTPDAPLEIEAMVVSHGDADHFAGLTAIHASEALADQPFKQLFVRPKRVFHSGLVKRPSSVAEKDSFGATFTAGDQTIVTGLEEDLLAVPASQMNAPFKAWRQALAAWNDRAPIEFRRLAKGDDDAFGFLAGEQIKLEVMGPLETTLDGHTGLRFLGTPRAGTPVAHFDEQFGGLDASHTINGQSVVLRLTFGKWRLLFAGDLNTEAERALTSEGSGLRSEVFKVPHHGSHEFAPGFLKAVSPLISVVSSGDESARKEYVHPRATLMSALGRYARNDASLVFVTELVAFFRAAGWVVPVGPKPGRSFFGFERTAYGLVHIRTDGRRLLVYTDTGKRDLKEAYAFEAKTMGRPEPVAVIRG